MLNNVLICFLLVISVEAANVGEACTKEGASGICTDVKNCRSSIEDIRNKKLPQICSFDGKDPIVCCLDGGQPGITLLTTERTITTEASQDFPSYYGSGGDSDATCDPLGPTHTAAKTGQKAWDKCIEYQERLVYPCKKNKDGAARENFCGFRYDLIIREEADKNEFSHMVLFGYGNSTESLMWLCAGSLVSERFILTAGHCATSREYGPITYALISAYKRSELDSTRLYKVKRIIRHPEYKPPSRYNDIALLETETEIRLDRWTVPACLDTDTNNTEERATVTGWAATELEGPRSDILRMGSVSMFSTPECEASYPPARSLKNSIDEKTQICYGARTLSVNCQGDSGGPLQVRSKQINCMYKIIGVTSFSKACGFLNEPGVYTKVSAFVPWIESVVWP